MIIVSRALQAQDGRVPCPVNIDFCSFLDNVEIIVIISVSEKKSRGHRGTLICVRSKDAQ